MPMEPLSMEARSDRISPNMLVVTITSNCFGLRTSCMAALSTSKCCNSTSGYPAAVSITTSRHSTVASSTFSLSTEHSRLPRCMATLKAVWAIRRISVSV